MELILGLILILAFAISYSIGANDAANALGTSYGSNAAKLWVLLVLGAIFELFGAVYCSSKISGTLVQKLIPEIYQETPGIEERLMLGTSISSFSFILVSSIFGMPISGTHTVIGALIGSGLAGLSYTAINWTKFGWTAASWFISPLISSIVAGLLFTSMCSLTLGG
jgi:inorganic phosphate transporter, PiT family